MATDDSTAMTPVAAVVRHLEWLEFALAAARDEETRRRERLGRATDKNRDKRTVRLAEVTAEVRELGALVRGLKELQARPAAGRSVGSGRASTRSSAWSTTKRKPATRANAKPAATAPKPTATAAAASNPATASKKPAAAKPATASKKPAAAKPTTKPRSVTAAKTRTRRRASKPSTPSA